MTLFADPTIADRTATVKKEAAVAARAAFSSVIATLTDAALYELLLFVAMRGQTRGPYAAAAASGALAGAVVNFSLNRFWAFRSQDEGVIRQIVKYAAGSAMTLLFLEMVLYVIVEKLAFDARAAWLPAKLFTWAMFSYPYQRWIVFARAPRR